MKNIIQKNKEIIMYLVFGVLTTVVNIVVYLSLIHILYFLKGKYKGFGRVKTFLGDLVNIIK